MEGLGRIERAAVDIHPLMLLVGPNNTGKSYLASLLWGLVAMQAELEPSPGSGTCVSRMSHFHEFNDSFEPLAPDLSASIAHRVHAALQGCGRAQPPRGFSG
ncbi:Hypothetical protein CAP_6091 [Chondromyces apiculatus DSM 436]|uniref:AAA domain-containing protein n=1 Tax=Chondromyces apiculatus DSM 436 TaxID=1192034 RepID=A0A017THL0_9BACT|nr:Hypothetical protein CAP_6091 [Chondromyces apiculatus DSM 436]